MIRYPEERELKSDTLYPNIGEYSPAVSARIAKEGIPCSPTQPARFSNKPQVLHSDGWRSLAELENPSLILRAGAETTAASDQIPWLNEQSAAAIVRSPVAERLGYSLGQHESGKSHLIGAVVEGW